MTREYLQHGTWKTLIEKIDNQVMSQASSGDKVSSNQNVAPGIPYNLEVGKWEKVKKSNIISKIKDQKINKHIEN